MKTFVNIEVFVGKSIIGKYPNLGVRTSHLEKKVALRARVLATVTLHDGGAGGHVQHHLVEGGGGVVI